MGTGPRVAAGTITLDLNQAEQGFFFPLMDLNVGVLFGVFVVVVEYGGKGHFIRAQPGTSLKSGNTHEPSTPINECK